MDTVDASGTQSDARSGLASWCGRPLLVAHRAGNDPAALERALDAGAPWIEADVHRLRRRLEVRHEKALLWSTRWRYEGRALVRASAGPVFGDVAGRVPDGVGVLVDLKGFRRALTRSVLVVRRADQATILSSRQWYLVNHVHEPCVLRCWSIGSRVQRQLARRLVRPRLVDAVALHSRLADATTVGDLRARLAYVLAWSVRDAVHADALLRAGVNGLILDDLDLLVRLAAR